MSEVKLNKNQFVHKLCWDSKSSSIICLLNGVPEVVLLKVSNSSLSVDSSRSLTADGMNMCSFKDGYLILTNNAENPFEYVSVNNAPEQNIRDGVISKLNEDVRSRWSSFRDVNKNMVEFYANLSKMNFENIEQHMERKGKRPPAHVEKQDVVSSKSIKIAGT